MMTPTHATGQGDRRRSFTGANLSESPPPTLRAPDPVYVPNARRTYRAPYRCTEEGKCAWCGGDITAHGKTKRARWCSEKCSDGWMRECGYLIRRDTLIREWEKNRTFVKCARCPKTKKIIEEKNVWWQAEGFAADHIVPLALGGARLDLANLQVLCDDCHREKTKTDAAAIAFARRGGIPTKTQLLQEERILRRQEREEADRKAREEFKRVHKPLEVYEKRRQEP